MVCSKWKEHDHTFLWVLVCVTLLLFGLGYHMQEDGKVNFKVLKVGILKLSLLNYCNSLRENVLPYQQPPSLSLRVHVHVKESFLLAGKVINHCFTWRWEESLLGNKGFHFTHERAKDFHSICLTKYYYRYLLFRKLRQLKIF